MAFPLFQQLDAMDCGPTCLRMVAAHHGRQFDREYLRKLCSIGKEGVSILGMAQAAEKIGLRSLAVRLPYDKLINEAPLPCIAHWDQSHFVVITKVTRSKVEIADPNMGKVVYTHEEFQEHWQAENRGANGHGILLLLEPTPEFHASSADGSALADADKPSSTQGLGYFLSYVRPHRKLFGQVLIGLGVTLIFSLITPFLSQTVVDLGIGNMDLNLILIMLLAQFVMAVGFVAIEILESWTLLHIGSRISLSLIADFLNKLLKLPLSFFDTRTAGDIMQRIEDHERVKTFLTSSSLQVVFSVVSFVVFGGILAYYNLGILVVFLIFTALSAGWLTLFMKKRRGIDNRRFDLDSKEQDKFVELVQGVQEIKLQGMERQKRWEWERLGVSHFKLDVRGLALRNFENAGATFFDQMRNILIAFLAARAVIRGEMSLGMMLSTQFIVGQLSAPVGRLLDFMHQAQDAKLSLERMAEIYHHPEEEHYAKTKTTQFPPGRSIVLHDLCFRYQGAGQKDVLNKLNLFIPEGRVTAIVGPSGSGKTTLLKLLLGLHKPTSGSIYVGNSALDNFDDQAWRARCGVVMQDGYIFPDTLARNIAVAHDNPNELYLRWAVYLASLQEFTESLPLGLATKIGDDGVGLSGGQRQRVLIARAIYKNPEFFFLDEATSSLDSSNERAIMTNLEEFNKGRTVIVIAHRLSTVKNADQIAVMDRGSIVEIGSHAELIKRRGAYYNLVKNQLELDSWEAESSLALAQ